MVKCGSHNLGPGKNIWVTGIGGGVALMALMFIRSTGANVYVTSGEQEKIDRAKRLGAKGGVNYREKGWEKSLVQILSPQTHFDAIVDGAGGDIVEKGAKMLKPGGVITIYGMTTGPKAPFSMQAVLKNIEIRGSTIGSRKEFRDMINFIKEKEVKSKIARMVSSGIEDPGAIDGLFEDMRRGTQFGKLVVEITKGQKSSKI